MQGMAPQASPESGGNKTLLIGCSVLAVLLLVCVGIWVAVVMVVGTDTLLALAGLGPKAQAASFAPVNAPIFASLDVDFQQAVNFQKVWSAFEQSPRAKQNTDDFKKQFRDAFSCDFDADIAPWWGPDLAFFFTDLTNLAPSTTSSRATTSAPPNFVVAMGVRDQAKATAAIQKCVPKDQTARTETYKNNNLKIYKDATVALVANHVLVSTTTDAMRAAIDAQTGGATTALANSAKYKNALANLPTSRTATFYADFAPLAATYLKSQPGIQPQILTQLDAYQAVAGSLAFVENGVNLDTAITFDMAKLPECSRNLAKQQTTPTKALNALPANTLGVVAAHDWKSLWDCSLSVMDATSRKQMQDSFDMVKKQTGIDINTDVFDWMTGDFAIAMTPAKPVTSGAPGLGFLLFVEAKDQSGMTAKLDKIVDALAKQGMPPMKDQNIKGVTFKTAKLGSPSDPNAPAAGYGFTGGFLVIGGPLDALDAAVGASSNALTKDATYTSVQTGVGKKNSSVFYVNVSSAESVYASTLTGRARTSYETEVQPWVKPIKAMGIASEMTKPDASVSTLFIYIAK